MVTVILLFAIFVNTLLGTLPLFGPMISGMVMGMIIGEKDLARVISFLGAIIGGVWSRILLSYPQNTWHQYLLTFFGKTAAYYAEIIIKGNLFFLVFYFGLLGVLGAYSGVLIKNYLKK